MNRLTLFITGCLAVVVVAAAWFLISVGRFLSAPMATGDAPIVFEIAAGSAFGTISRRLAEQGYIDHPDWYRWYARATGRAGSVHAGEYRIEPGTTPRQLLQMFVDGDVRLYSFTIVEGWTFRDLIDALQQHDTLDVSIVYEDWPAILASFGAEEQHPEGLFLPETYRYPKGTTGRDILRQAYELMQATLAEEWQNRRAQLPIDSPYEALILASIVEKETALASERPRIAGVFTRRLQQNMRLQTDPTVIYGLGLDFDGNLTRRHLRSDTPYNTYTRGGLPPTPIALPGRAAINAAVQPADGSELFFVATGHADGSHTFSDTKEQHDAAVQEFLKRRRERRASQRPE